MNNVEHTPELIYGAILHPQFFILNSEFSFATSALPTIKFAWPREEFPARTIVKRHPEERLLAETKDLLFPWTSHVGGGKGRTAGPLRQAQGRLSAASAASG
jgi:hypothetical protein